MSRFTVQASKFNRNLVNLQLLREQFVYGTFVWLLRSWLIYTFITSLLINQFRTISITKIKYRSEMSINAFTPVPIFIFLTVRQLLNLCFASPSFSEHILYLTSKNQKIKKAMTTDVARRLIRDWNLTHVSVNVLRICQLI